MRNATRIILVATVIIAVGVGGASSAYSAGFALVSDGILKVAIWFAALVIEISFCFFCVRMSWLAVKSVFSKV